MDDRMELRDISNEYTEITSKLAPKHDNRFYYRVKAKNGTKGPRLTVSLAEDNVHENRRFLVRVWLDANEARDLVNDLLREIGELERSEGVENTAT